MGLDTRSDNVNGALPPQPEATMLADAGRHAGVATATVNLDAVWKHPRCSGWRAEEIRRFLTEDRRPELYRDLAESR